MHIHVKPVLPALGYFKGCCQEPSVERPQHGGGTWGLCVGLCEMRTPCPSPPSFALWASPGRMNNSFSKGLTSPIHAPFAMKTCDHSELFVQERGKTLEVGVLFLLCLEVLLITFFKNYIYHWLLVICVVLGYPGD